MSPHKNILICVVGPSGSGKSLCVENYLKEHADANIIVSDTTRPKRLGETDGVEYNFLTLEDYRQLKHTNEVVYNNNTYGVRENEITIKRANASVTFFICDVTGYRIMKSILPDSENVFGLYLKASSRVCALRMLKRDHDEAKVKSRIYYDVLINAYTLDEIVSFDKVVNAGQIYNSNKNFAEAVDLLREKAGLTNE